MVEAVIPECYIDTNLIQILVPPNLRYNHQKGCDSVSKTMQSKYQGKVAVGIIDKDKRKIKYLGEFEEIRNCDQNLFLLKHKTEEHFLILIQPAIESFMLKVAKEEGIVLSDYGLPDNSSELKKITGKILSQNDERLNRLFKDLKQTNNKSIKTLIHWVNTIKNSSYTVNIAKL